VDGDLAQGKVIGLLRLCQALGFREATLRVLRASGADAVEGEIPVNLENYGFVSYGRRANPAKPRPIPDGETPTVDGVLVDIKAAEKSDLGIADGEFNTLVVQDARGGGFACSTLEKLKKYLDILKEEIEPAKETAHLAIDPKLKYGRFLDVMEPCQKMGFGRIVLHEPKAGDPADVFE
jgi:biopolymer transport protein ExbD